MDAYKYWLLRSVEKRPFDEHNKAEARFLEEGSNQSHLGVKESSIGDSFIMFFYSYIIIYVSESWRVKSSLEYVMNEDLPCN